MSEKCYYGNINSSYTILYVDDVRKSKSIMVERCPLCNGTKRTFYCNKCVNTGQFFSSVDSCSDFKMSFEKRKVIFNKTKEKCQEMQYRLNKDLSHKAFSASKNNEKIILEFNIKHIKLKMEKLRNKIKQNKEYLDELKSGNKQALVNSNLMILKLDRIRKHLDGCPQRLDTNVLNLKRIKFDLMKCRQDHIKHLIQDIFLIRILSNSRESPDSTSNPCINLLSEARNTEYVKGEWVLSKSFQNSYHVYQIIEALLPANGQYTNEKFNYEKDKNLDVSKSISAALCLLSQIVTIISIILNGYLTSNISLKDFVLPSADSKLFSKCVSKLNSNVLQLCELQYINIDTLMPGQTILNLFKLLESPRLGSDEPPFVHDVEMYDSAGDNVSLEMLNDSSDSNEDSNAIVLDDRDWEYVTSTLPEAEMSIPGQYSTSYFSSTILQNGQTELQSTMTHLASGLVNSASLFWKGWSHKTDT